MVRGKTISIIRGGESWDRVSFYYSKCDGMFQHYNEVDKDWFDAHNTESMTAEELEGLAWNDKANSHVDGHTSCWGLG